MFSFIQNGDYMEFVLQKNKLVIKIRLAESVKLMMSASRGNKKLLSTGSAPYEKINLLIWRREVFSGITLFSPQYPGVQNPFF
jgi:hypothetical protein